jgi:hypothetical protein
VRYALSIACLFLCGALGFASPTQTAGGGFWARTHAGFTSPFAAEQMSVNGANWTLFEPQSGSQPLAVPADTSSVFHIGPYISGGVPVSKDIYKSAGETEDHFDARCANAFKSFTQLFPPDPR